MNSQFSKTLTPDTESLYSACYEIIQPWAVICSNGLVQVHDENVELVRRHLMDKGFLNVRVEGIEFPIWGTTRKERLPV